MRSVLAFPNPVNEKAARVVAGVVALTSAVALASGAYWLLAPLAHGFVARVLAGPAFSPVGRFAVWFAGRVLGPARPVDGPPKRFAQAIGAVCTSIGAVAWFGLARQDAAIVVLAIMTVFATLESLFGLCVGCRLFAIGARLGLVPEGMCAECADLSLRYPNLAARRARRP